MSLILHGYWRSGATYRLRIALNLKKLRYEQVTHDLRTGAQRDAAYVRLAPQGRVPALELDGHVLIQSLAIMEWLDEVHPQPPLLPSNPLDRAIVRGMAQLIACDIHPLGNLPVLQRLRAAFAASEESVSAWIAHWIAEGFAALEVLIARHGGPFAFGDTPTLADCCLVPQLYAARRFGVDLTPYPCVVSVGDVCTTLPAFIQAEPSRQPDASPRVA